MGITAISGPHVVFGLTRSSTGQVSDYNDQRGPSLYDLGTAFADPRYNFAYSPGDAVTTKVYGFFGQEAAVDYVPITAQTSALRASAAGAPTAGSALTLATASSAVGTYETTIVAPETGQTTGTLIAIDSTAQYLSFGDSDTVTVWNPAAGAGRCITLTPAGNSSLDGGSWSIAGRDVYGFKVTETIPVSSQVMTSQKAFKYISSIVAATTIGSTGVGIGFNNTFGLPLLASNTGGYLNIKLTPVASLQYALSSGPVTLGTTATATSTTIDVRGTYASTTATNGTMRLTIRQTITPAMANSVTASDWSAMFGATQYSSV